MAAIEERAFLCLERADRMTLKKANSFYKVDFVSTVTAINTSDKTVEYDAEIGLIIVHPFEDLGYSKSFLAMFSCQSDITDAWKVQDHLRAFVHTTQGHHYYPQTDPNIYNSQGVAYDGPYFYRWNEPPQHGPALGVSKHTRLLQQTQLNVACVLSVAPHGDYIVAEVQAQQYISSPGLHDR